MCTVLKNKDVGIGLSMISCLGLGIFLFPFFFHEVTSLHPPSFQTNEFSTCSTCFIYLGQSPNKNGMDRQLTSSMHFGGCFGEFC